MQISTNRTVQLPEEIGMYVDTLRKACPAVGEVWLVGPRVDEETPPRGAEWRLLAFADRKALETLRAEPAWRRPDVTVLVVIDGDRFENAWGTESGRLSRLDWRLEDQQSATYVQYDRDAGRHGAGRSAGVRVR